MTVNEAIADCKPVTDEPVTVEGHLIVTKCFIYLAASANEACGILVQEPRLESRLMECVPSMVGSLVLFSGSATVEGLLHKPTGLPMFPAVLHSVSAVVYRHADWRPTRLEFA